VPPSGMAELETLVDQKRIEVHHIGEITKGSGVTCLYNGEEVSLNNQGYQHFDSNE